MIYRKTFSNSYLQVTVHTNRKQILTLLGNFLDFGISTRPSRPKIKVRFHLHQGAVKAEGGKRKGGHLTRFANGETHAWSFDGVDARVTSTFSTHTIKAVFSKYTEPTKEKLVYFVFTTPLQRMLSRSGLFFLHASMVAIGSRCMLICGSVRSGKSTLALIFAQHGFEPLSDDDCFIQMAGRGVRVMPFSTKGGLRERLLKRHPELGRRSVKGFRYYKRKRVSFRALARHPERAHYHCEAILFPVYRAKQLAVRPLPKQEVVRRLLKSTLMYEYADREHEALWVLYALARQAPAVELRYHDERLDEIPALVRGVLR